LSENPAFSKPILYTAPGCHVSDRARRDLLADGVDFEERDVMKEKAWFNEALRYAVSVPILVRDGKAQVGWKGSHG
jgi:glutaredoxin